MKASFVPFLTQYDPELSSDGSLDPLGLFPIADRLAMKLAPGVRERMSHPRFLTAMAVGAVICSDFDDDTIAKDMVSEPWQIYEWYVVQALIKTFFNNRAELHGLPGSDKATQAYLKGIPLNASRYLKTASVFGFHGVYRTLANELHIMEGNNALGEIGDKLVRVWEKEQQLEGFYSSHTGPGREFRQLFKSAISDGLEKGEVAKPWNWNFNSRIATHLAPYKGGKKELEVIYEALISENTPIRTEVTKFLQEQKGTLAWIDKNSEKDFHQAMAVHASQNLKQLLTAIQYFEQFSSLINNAFRTCIFHLSSMGILNAQQLSELEPVKQASSGIEEAFENACRYLEPIGETGNFYNTFFSLNEKGKSTNWINTLIQYHKSNQKRKPPAGKLPWIEIMPGDKYIIYTRYKVDKLAEIKDEYVNYYRTRSLWSFLKDLKQLEYA